MLTGLECNWDPASVRQTNEYVIGLSELKRTEQRQEMDGVFWQMLFDESGRDWGKVCLKGEAALRNDKCQPSLRIISVDIGAKLDAQGVMELAISGLTRDELSRLLSWLTDNCSTMSGMKGGAVTRLAVKLISDGIRQTMLPRPACVLHAIALPYANGHKALVGPAPAFKRGFAKTLQLDSYLKNIEYWGDKDWDSTRSIMVGLGYVALPKWKKYVQIVHNILPLDQLKPHKTEQIQIIEIPCAREKMKKAKTNRWLFNWAACKSAERHDWIDLMYCLQQCTQIDYRDADRPRIWISSKHKDTMEGRHIKWRCGASVRVQMVQCHLKAEVDFGNNLINPMHCRSIRRGDTRIVPFVLPVGLGKGESSQYNCAHDVNFCDEGEITSVRQTTLTKLTPTQVLECLPHGYRMLEISPDAEDWLLQLLHFKQDPFRSTKSVFHRSYTCAQSVLFPRPRDWSADPLNDFERDLQNCANAAFTSGEEWFRPMTRFPYLAGQFSSAERGPALARAVLVEKFGLSTLVESMGEFPTPGAQYTPHSPAYNSDLFQPRRIAHASQSELASKYSTLIVESVADEAKRQYTAFREKWATDDKKSVREQVALEKSAFVHANKLFDSFQFLETVFSSPMMRTDFKIFSMANTLAGIQMGITPYIHHYPRLHIIFRKTVAAQLIHQQKIENDFGKIDNISKRSSKARMKALMLWRENVQRTAFNNESIQQLGTREQRGFKKKKRIHCEFDLVEYKSKVVKSECLKAAKDAKRKSRELESAACLNLTEVTMKRKESKAKEKKSNAAPTVPRAKTDQQVARLQAFDKCCGGCECGSSPCGAAGLVKCSFCGEVKKSTCMKKACKEERSLGGAVLDTRVPKKRKAATPMAPTTDKGNDSSESGSSDDSGSGDNLCDDSDSDEYAQPQFRVGDAVSVYWSMESPPDWFYGEVVQRGSREIKVFYPEESRWQWHDPRKWDVEHIP